MEGRIGDRCAEARARILEHGPTAGGEHVEGCAPCRAFAACAGRLAGAFRALPRRRAPFELDGRVVAALEAGHRQDRAVRSVGSLDEVPAPDELSEKLGRALGDEGAGVLDRAPAPAVLDRLVAEELAGPEAARVRRHVGGLSRRTAPPELLERVERDLAGRPARRSRRVPARAGLLAAAVLLAVLGVSRVLGPADPGSEAPLALEFAVVRTADPADLSPMARAFTPVRIPGTLGTEREERR